MARLAAHPELGSLAGTDRAILSVALSSNQRAQPRTRGQPSHFCGWDASRGLGAPPKSGWAHALPKPAHTAQVWIGPRAAQVWLGPRAAQAWLGTRTAPGHACRPVRPGRRTVPDWATRPDRGPGQLGPRLGRVTSQAAIELCGQLGTAGHVRATPSWPGPRSSAQPGLGGEPRPAAQRGSIAGLAIQGPRGLAGRRPAIGPPKPD